MKAHKNSVRVDRWHTFLNFSEGASQGWGEWN